MLVTSYKNVEQGRKNALHPLLKIRAADYSKLLAPIYQITRCHNSAKCNLNIHSQEMLKSHTFTVLCYSEFHHTNQELCNCMS
jgi:hypothetical protein